MKKIVILGFVAFLFVGCGSILVPTPVQSNVIKPNESCNN